MKAASAKEIKQELNNLSHEALKNLCLRLSRFKKENKELLTYLLFESYNEDTYINSIKQYIDEEFQNINTKSYFFIRKSVRKTLRNTKKYIRYSQKNETEIELLLYFCKTLKNFSPSIKHSVQLVNVYNRQLALAKKKILSLHEDLQYDYTIILEELQH